MTNTTIEPPNPEMGQVVEVPGEGWHKVWTGKEWHPITYLTGSLLAYEAVVSQGDEGLSHHVLAYQFSEEESNLGYLAEGDGGVSKGQHSVNLGSKLLFSVNVKHLVGLISVYPGLYVLAYEDLNDNQIFHIVYLVGTTLVLGPASTLRLTYTPVRTKSGVKINSLGGYPGGVSITWNDGDTRWGITCLVTHGGIEFGPTKPLEEIERDRIEAEQGKIKDEAEAKYTFYFTVIGIPLAFMLLGVWLIAKGVISP